MAFIKVFKTFLEFQYFTLSVFSNKYEILHYRVNKNKKVPKSGDLKKTQMMKKNYFDSQI